MTFDDEEAWKLNEDPTRAHILDVNGVYEPEIFAAVLNDNVQRSKVAMSMGSVTTNAVECELFEAIGSALVEANATMSAV